MSLDVRDCLLVCRQFFFLFTIVIAEVARIEHIILDRVVVISQRLQVMRPDEPLFVVLARHRILNVLQVVVRGQVQIVRRRDVVVHQLGPILDNTKALIWVISLTALDIDEALLDILGLLCKLLLLFKLFLQVFVFSHHP